MAVCRYKGNILSPFPNHLQLGQVLSDPTAASRGVNGKTSYLYCCSDPLLWGLLILQRFALAAQVAITRRAASLLAWQVHDELTG